MTAEDVLQMMPRDDRGEASVTVSADEPLANLLARLVETPEGRVQVIADSLPLGVIDREGALRACSRLIPRREESSSVSVLCTPSQYSASALARAVEDADAHLTDLYTLPAPHGNLEVVMRVSRLDPAPVAHSLRRYGFTVNHVEGAADSDQSQALERITALRRYFDL